MSVYDALGGEQGVLALTDRFYDLMDLEPQYAALRAVHSDTLDYARDRLFKFLSGWLGGPDLYQQQYGHRANDGCYTHSRIAQISQTGEGHSTNLS